MVTLRSNFDPGTTRWAVRRAQWRAMGIDDEDTEKPKIAVVNSSSQLSICYQHLDRVSDVIQQAIRQAAGLPFEIRTVAPSDFVTSAGREARYLLPSRDLIVNDIEVMVEGAMLDGMVCLASCDKTTPAHLMAAGRLNVPTIVVVCGYQLGGMCCGRMVDIDDVYEAVGAVVADQMSIDELKEMADCAIVGPGVCAGMGTANTMHIRTCASRRNLGLEDVEPETTQQSSQLRGSRRRRCGRAGMVADGMTEDEILAAYPDPVREDIREALRYTAEAVRERELPLTAP